MKYYTENELQNFRFEGAYIAENLRSQWDL